MINFAEQSFWELNSFCASGTDCENKTMPSLDNDINIVRSVLNGHTENFELLIEKYRSKVFMLVGKRIPANDIEDVAQDAFIRSFSSLSTYSMKKPFENWLSIITLRCCCDYWRKQGRRKEFSAPVSDIPVVQWLEDLSSGHSQARFEHVCRRLADGELLQWTLEQLDPEDKTLIEMLYFEERPLAQAAQVLEWGLSKTKVRAMRARKKMRKIISELIEDNK
jgi:RNA polymerase sigma-70 factor (ECF subfamily)